MFMAAISGRIMKLMNSCASATFLASAGIDEAVEPHQRALARDDVADLDAVLGFLGAVLGLDHVARIAHRHADVAVGERVDVFGGVELLDVAADAEQGIARPVQILDALRIRVEAEIGQHAGEEILGAESSM